MASPSAVADSCGDSVSLEPKEKGMVCVFSQLHFQRGEMVFSSSADVYLF